MGRIGSGELGTLVFGIGGPLLHLAIAFGLIGWGRSLMRRGKGTLASAGFYAAVAALLSALLGILLTILGLIRAFGEVAAVDPSRRSLVLSEGISGAMWGTALGVSLSLVLYAASFVSLFLASRAPSPK